METKQNETGLELENNQELQPEAIDGPAAEKEAEAEKASGQPEVPGPENKKAKRPSEKGLRSGKWKRGTLATVMSLVFIAIVVVVNVLVGALTDRFPSMDMDLTAQKLNTLSDQALEIAKGVEQETTIYLIGSEDAYRKDQAYSNYGLQYSQVSNLAEKLREANSKISVEFIDPDTNPSFISQYPSETLNTGTVLVTTEKRYKVLHVNDLFSLQSDSTTGGTNRYSQVDSALAGALEVVNMDKVPVLTIATGHGELLTSDTLSSFQSMMEDQNFEVREIDFLTEDIPEETQVLMIPTPTTDYTEEEIQKLRDYLDDETRDEDLALLVTFHTTQGQLPKLTNFLEEWGVKVEEGIVAETDSSRVALRNAGYVLVDSTDTILTDNEYPNLIAAASRPLTLMFDGNGDISAESLWTTSDSAYVATEDMTEAEAENPETGVQTVATVSKKYADLGDNKFRQRHVLVFGSSYIFTDTFMSATAFGNKDYISDLMKYSTGTDGSSVSVRTSQVQTSTLDISASIGTMNLLGLGVFTVGLPVLILVAGLVIFLKRRHL